MVARLSAAVQCQDCLSTGVMYGSMRSEEKGVIIGDAGCARKVPRVMRMVNEVNMCFIMCLFVFPSFFVQPVRLLAQDENEVKHHFNIIFLFATFTLFFTCGEILSLMKKHIHTFKCLCICIL